MLSPAPMRKLRIFVLEGHVRDVTRALGKLGVMHLQSSVEESGGLLQPEQLDAEVARCRDLTARLEGLMARLGIEKGDPAAPEAASGAAMDEVEALLAPLEEQVAPRSQQLGEAREALTDAEETLAELEPYKDVTGPLSPLVESAFLEFKAGSVAGKRLAELRSAMPESVLLLPLAASAGREGRTFILAVGPRRRRFAMETVLDEHGFSPEPIRIARERTPAEVYAQAVRNRLSLQGRVNGLRDALHAAGQPHAESLRRARADLTLQRKLQEAQQEFGTTWATAVISGWVPADRAEELRRAVMAATRDQAVVEVAPPSPEDIEKGRVPSLVKHSPLLAPFERLLRGYGLATYTEIEPTVLFAATFLLMFGLIFGDLGHGLCLVAIGLLVRRLARTKGSRDLGFVIAVSGASASLFGAFFQGSFFGKSLTDLGFPLTLGFEPVRFEGAEADAAGHVMRYLLLAMAFGMAVITLGAVLNAVNRFRRGDYAGALLDRFGVTGMVFYWGAIGLTAKLIAVGAGPLDVWVGLGVIGAPLLLVMFGRPLRRLLSRRKPAWEGNPALGLLEGAIEAFETVLVYTANTFSFLRVAAFALSHAALCFTIFVLEGMVSRLPGGPVWSVAVFVAGTALILSLEGLIVAVQILRLEYYEFLTKFFSGEGTRYEPFRLD